MNRRRWIVGLFAALFLVALAAGCSDDNNTPMGDTTVDTTVDAPATDYTVDQSQPDQFVWPDQGQPDQIIWPDSYSGAPFGCQTNADCFGQKCCKTPWGVKLCAATCPQ